MKENDMFLEPFEDFVNSLDLKLDEVNEINVVRHCLDDGDKNVWQSASANKPSKSGRYILYLSNDKDVSFTWVGKYNSVSKTWEVRLPFIVKIEMWRYFPKQPSGRKHDPFVLDDITGTIGGTQEVVRE